MNASPMNKLQFD